MNLLLRVALLAYPRSFRRRYGAEWTRTIADMRTHSHHSATRVGGTVVAEALTTAIRMRWENLMKTTKTLLTVIAAIITPHANPSSVSSSFRLTSCVRNTDAAPSAVTPHVNPPASAASKAGCSSDSVSI